jgi:hypothetical protein
MKHNSKLDRFMESLIDKIEYVGELIIVFGFILLMIQLLRIGF